jgi:phospholipid/cholesterol/gamma-HCH transport system substrate-binding protein
MDTHTQRFKVRLGLFIAGGLLFFAIAIFLIGKQQNLFNPVFKITTTFFNVSGLQVGNNVRFSGINVGIVDAIRIINDSTVQVDMLIRKDVQEFIKADSEASINSDGIIGDKVLVISQGSNTSPMATDGQRIKSQIPVEFNDIILSLQASALNVEIISFQLAEIMVNINSGEGALGRLIHDPQMAENTGQTILNLKKSSKGLDENMQALQENFLLRGYFRRKAKLEEAAKEAAIKDRASGTPVETKKEIRQKAKEEAKAK